MPVRRTKLWPLLVGAAVIAILTAAWASGANVTGAEPAVGTPRQGDAARYAITQFEDGHGSDGGEFVLLWNGTAERRDRFGVPRAVDVVDGGFVHEGYEGYGYDLEVGMPFELAYAAGRVAPTVFSVNYDGGGGGESGAFSNAWAYDGAYRSYEGFGYATGAMYCIPRAAWQGLPIGQLAGADLLALCPGLAADWFGLEPAPLTPVGEKAFDNATAHGFRATLQWAEDWGETVTLWFVDGLPYPVELRLDHGEGHATVLTLEGYGPGDGALLTGAAAPEPARRPGATFDAPGRWGVVEGDAAQFAYPPSEATAALENDPTLVRFQEYLATHPTARVVEYTYHEDDPERGAAAEASWRFTFSDESGEGWVVSTQRTWEARGGAPLPAPVTQNEDEGPEARDPLDPDDVPDAVMSLGDAVRIYRENRRPDDPLFNHATGGLEGWSPVGGGTIHAGHADMGWGPSAEDPTNPTVGGGGAFAGHTFEATTGATRMEYVTRFGYAMGVASGPFHGWGFAWGGSGVPDVDVSDVAYPAAVGATVLALLAYYLQAALVRFVAVPLFTRLQRGDVLDNANRAALMEAVRDDPGTHTSALMGATGLGNGALLYHLEVLTREGLLTRVEHGGYTRYFVAGDMPHGEMRKRAVLLSGSHQRIFETIRAEPGLSQADVAERVGLSAPAVHHAVKKLEAEGLVQRRREGRRVALHAGEDPLVRR